MTMLRCLPMDDNLALEARAPPHLPAHALTPSPAPSTLEILVHPLEGLLAHSALLVGVPELEELGAEGAGLPLRGLQHGP